MAWYRTGTITVTNGSTTVTGSGTSWIANAGIGEALYAPDGRLYEIANIASNTSITLASAYLGTTASAQTYVLVPSQSYIRDLAAQAADLVNNYATIYNTIGQSKFPDGTLAEPGIRFNNDLDTGFFRSAANEVTFVAGGVAQFKYDASGVTFTTGGALVGATATQTLTNKTISADNNTLSGIAASSFVLSNASGNIDGSVAQKVIPAGVVVGTTDTQTLTNKTISADNNILSGIAASSFVVSNASGNIDGSAAQKVIPAGVVVGTTDTQTLTNKTLTTPTITGGTVNPTTLQENGSPVVVQTDIGTAPNEIPLNQYLGNLAYQDAANIAGNVGIGGVVTATSGVINANSTSDALRITQIGTGNALLVEDSANPDATPFVINNSGAALVGVDTTRTLFTAYTPNLQIEGTTFSASSQSITLNINTAASPTLWFAKSRGTTNGSNTIVSANDALGVISFNGADGTDIQSSAAQISAAVDGTPGADDMPGRLVFATTADGASSPTERMRIDNAGNVIHAAPTTAPTLATNGTMVFNLTSNTNLRVSVRGTDGVTRTANLTLA